MHSRSGFSLIELLVVIAIIAILAAMMFPVFSRAREKARSIACLSNIRQISMALYMYAKDYGGKMPQGSYTAPDMFGNVVQMNGYDSWPSFIYPYVHNTQIFRCPSSSSDQLSPKIVDNYAYNYDLLQNVRARYIPHPSETMVVMDFHDSYVIPGPNTRENFLIAAGDGLRRHNDGANIAFADGHAKFMPEGAIKAQVPGSGEESPLLGYTMQ